MLKIKNALRRFVADKSGAVTVDWVALTAAVVIIGIGIVYAVFDGEDGVSGLVDNLTTELGVASTNIDGAVTALGGLPTSGGS